MKRLKVVKYSENVFRNSLERITKYRNHSDRYLQAAYSMHRLMYLLI